MKGGGGGGEECVYNGWVIYIYVIYVTLYVCVCVCMDGWMCIACVVSNLYIKRFGVVTQCVVCRWPAAVCSFLPFSPNTSTTPTPSEEVPAQVAVFMLGIHTLVMTVRDKIKWSFQNHFHEMSKQEFELRRLANTGRVSARVPACFADALSMTQSQMKSNQHGDGSSLLSSSSTIRQRCAVRSVVRSVVWAYYDPYNMW